MKDSKVMRFIAHGAARYYLKKPDQADLIHIKYPQLSDLWPAALNELCYRIRSERSYRLLGLNIELTNRCNLSCAHCPRSELAKRNEHDMDFDTFKEIIDQVPGLKTLLPYQWGEPMLNPHLFDCIAYAASRGIRVMLTTNATLLNEEKARKLISSGLDRLTISFDGSKETHAHLRETDPDRILFNAKRFKEVRDSMGSSCSLDASMVVDEITEPHMDDFRALFDGVSDRIQFIPRFIAGKRRNICRELWRGVLVVLSNGDVTVCCADVQGKAVIGNIKETSPKALFNCKTMRRIRRHHLEKAFVEPCHLCSEYASPLVSPRFS